MLQDGTFNVDDDIHRYRNGFVFGEGDPSMRTSPTTVQSGLAFWSRPADNKTPHLHVDDWNNATGAGEFGYPIGYTAVTRTHPSRTPRPPTRSMEERSGLHTTRRTRAGP